MKVGPEVGSKGGDKLSRIQRKPLYVQVAIYSTLLCVLVSYHAVEGLAIGASVSTGKVANQNVSGLHNQVEARRDFVLPKGNVNHRLVPGGDKGTNFLAEQYAISQLLTGRGRKRKISGLLDMVELNMLSTSPAIKFAKEFSEIIDASPMTREGVVALAKRCSRKKLYNRAILLYYSSSSVDPQDCTNQMNAIEKMEYNTELLARNGNCTVLVREFIIPLMHDVFNQARRVTCSSRDDAITQVAWCLRYIGMAYYSIGDDAALAEKSEEAVRFLDEELSVKAPLYKVYAWSLDSAAAAYQRMGNNKKSLRYYQLALSAYRAATDWADSAEQNFSIGRAEINVRNVQSLLADNE